MGDEVEAARERLRATMSDSSWWARLEAIAALAALEELRRERYEVVDEAPGVFVQDGRVHRTPLVDEERFRALLRAGRKCEPTFRDVMGEFGLSRRRGPGGSGRTGA